MVIALKGFFVIILHFCQKKHLIYVMRCVKKLIRYKQLSNYECYTCTGVRCEESSNAPQ